MNLTLTIIDIETKLTIVAADRYDGVCDDKIDEGWREVSYRCCAYVACHAIIESRWERLVTIQNGEYVKINGQPVESIDAE